MLIQNSARAVIKASGAAGCSRLTGLRLPQPPVPRSGQQRDGACCPQTPLYTYTWLGSRINRRDTLSTHTDTKSTDGLILFPSLPDQNEGPFMGNTYPYLQWGSHRSAQELSPRCQDSPVTDLRIMRSLDPQLHSSRRLPSTTDARARTAVHRCVMGPPKELS